MTLVLPAYNKLIGGSAAEPDLDNWSDLQSSGPLLLSGTNNVFILAPDGTNIWLNTGNRYSLWTCAPGKFDVSGISGAADAADAETIVGVGGGQWSRNDPQKLYLANSDDIVSTNGITTDYGMLSSRTSVGGLTAVGFSVSSFCWNDDGTEAFLLSNTDFVKAYTLSTAYDISTATANASKDLNLNTLATLPFAPTTISMSPSGKRLFFDNTSAQTVVQAGMSTPFDPSTAVFETDLHLPTVVGETGGARGFALSDDGQYLFFYNSDTVKFHRIRLA